MRVADLMVQTSVLEVLLRSQERPLVLAWVTNDLPPDARILAVYDFPSRDAIILRLESETFRDIGRGEVIPMLQPQFVRHTEPLPDTETV